MKVAVATRDEQVHRAIRYLPPSAAQQAPENALAERAVRQLERYREDPDAKFDLPLLIEGTRVPAAACGQAMCAIPRGRTLTYGELARKLGGGEARAVGPGLRRQPAADRDPVPPRGRRGRHRRLRALDRRLPDRGQALAAAARGARGRVRAQALSAADARCSTRSATRCGWRTAWRRTRSSPTAGISRSSPLSCKGRPLIEGARGGPVRASSPRAAARAPAPRACSPASSASTSWCLRERAIAADPTLQAGSAEARAALSEDAVGGRRRGAARRAGRARAARPARPRDAGSALRLGPARLGAGRR